MSEFERWFADQDFYTNMRFIHGDNLFSKDGDVYRVLPVQMANVAWGENQSKIDQLNSVLEERTKEWLQAIECGTYFKNVAKPLKEVNDSLRQQLNNMEQCYIQLKQEHNDLIAFNTALDRKQKSTEKATEKYKSKVLMIADLLRDSTDKEMTIKAIKTVIDRVGEHV